eukprot:7391869-Prymnesium_polylepis.4
MAARTQVAAVQTALLSAARRQGEVPHRAGPPALLPAAKAAGMPSVSARRRSRRPCSALGISCRGVIASPALSDARTGPMTLLRPGHSPVASRKAASSLKLAAALGS